MRLVVISPPEMRSDEASVLGELRARGLTRYHVRKPGWTEDDLRGWLSALDPGSLSICVLHGHHALVGEFPVLGIHFSDTGHGSRRSSGGFVSAACHSLEAAFAAEGQVDAVLLSPVFDSISKAGRSASPDVESWGRYLKGRTPRSRATEIVALGGVTPANLDRCASLGFDGAAVLGCVWQSPDPVSAFDELIAALPTSHAA